MSQGHVPIIFQWDAGNHASALKNGITTNDCEKAVLCLAANAHDSAIWHDTANPQEGRCEERFVAVVSDVSPVGNIFICFTARHRRIQGMSKIIRIIAARHAHKREPILRASVPERFIPASPLCEILGA